MITIRRSEERGRFDFGWLLTYHSFSFGQYHDPDYMGFRSLRVLNDDTIQPGGSFDMHSHRDMEIITYVIDGRLIHRDDLGHEETLERSDVQVMTAGSGIRHSESGGKSGSTRLLQIWLLPSEKGLTPRHETKRFPEDGKINRLQLIVSPDGRENSLLVNQDVLVFAAVVENDEKTRYLISPGRFAWVQLASGQIAVNGRILRDGDGAALEDEALIQIEGQQNSEFLLFDLA